MSKRKAKQKNKANPIEVVSSSPLKSFALPAIFSANSLYLSFLYFRLFWMNDGSFETEELLTYKYMLYSIFCIYPVFIFTVLLFTKEVKMSVFFKILIFCFVAIIPALYFYTFDLWKEKSLFYGSIIVLLQCVIQSVSQQDEELKFRLAGVYAGKLLLWFVTLLGSMLFLSFYANRDILVHLLFGGFYYLFVCIFDIWVTKSKFLIEN